MYLLTYNSSKEQIYTGIQINSIKFFLEVVPTYLHKILCTLFNIDIHVISETFYPYADYVVKAHHTLHYFSRVHSRVDKDHIKIRKSTHHTLPVQ